MAVHLQEPEALHAVRGLRLGVAQAAIKERKIPGDQSLRGGRKDLTVIALDAGAQVAGVFTRNAFSAAPVQLCRERLAQDSSIRALVINAGNANAATGNGGLEDARAVCAAVGEALECAPEQVLPFSTGVIGQRLPVTRMRDAVPRAIASLSPKGWLDAMRAIMTTDTVGKGASRRVRTAQGEVTVTGIAKGVGMICPDMATLLAFVATDARLSRADTEAMLRHAVRRSFNCVTVDGDTSTNDACVLIASGAVGTGVLQPDQADFQNVQAAVNEVCEELAQAIVRDGEGATKFITIVVEGARDESEARCVAYSVANSPLVKTAMFASDANWGRIVMAIGKAGVEGLDPARIGLMLDDVVLLVNGQPHADYREERGAAVVAKDEFTIRIDLGRGDASMRVWTCDFSYDYVKINAEYRS